MEKNPLDHPPGWEVWPKPPPPGAIREGRVFAGLTQAEAARMVFVTVRTWQKWEAGGSKMRPGFWAQFCTKAKAHIRARASAQEESK